ncbi:hypothetical protein BRW65_01395 [Mycobacterium paraffinicum]|uniref:Mandelate racemase/muconate lactonizing enzyme C-terminal domain-containing protein n=1 Tax=Mycobacterium paraffinicum TaxID=53378 RepID=A0A1Q4I2M5_9MYCO|nr:mandelate racemase/muconate lactonizing enzyme family protein [Mycobacterium paraffinicum]OJZ76116.1 hypothetical protein BRW65_01395 [Mycobacterium paraffinicum]
MKVTGLRTTIVRLPIDPAIGLGGQGSIRSADCVLTFIDTDEGLTGEGLVFTLNNRGLTVIHAMVRQLSDLVVGLDPLMSGSLNARAGQDVNFLGKGVATIGVAAIDMALWDLRGKAAGLNVAHLIGACRASVPTYASGGLWQHLTIDELQQEANALVAKGFRAVKTRIGAADPHETVTRVRAVREAIGPSIALMVDAYQQLTVTQAIRIGRMLEGMNLTWFEEPVLCHDHTGEAEIRRALDTPLASGESVFTHRGILELLQAGAVDVAMPDLQRMGGPTGLLKAGQLCEAFCTPCSPHLFTEMSLALLAAMPSGYFLEYMPWFEAIYRERIQLDSDGNSVVTDRPGWGFSFDPEQVRRYCAS